MDAQSCREQMSRLIQEETTALGELTVLLDREYSHMSANDVDALGETMRERHKCVARILKVDDERRVLCRNLNRPHDLKGLEALLQWCDPKGTLAGAWADCTAAAIKCRTQNDRNAALAGARLQNVQARLGVLIDGRRETVTYGPRGTCSVSAARSGLFREA
ncbi:MAG TPA: flagellar protein FlgN [Steroidobacteraceae bacterium]|jgi:flagellar biosynthesis/type III secretory pathway chaperone|nr:flagellar protein FlgN [Steroidobacteraceae bacterium]